MKYISAVIIGLGLINQLYAHDQLAKKVMKESCKKVLLKEKINCLKSIDQDQKGFLMVLNNVSSRLGGYSGNGSYTPVEKSEVVLMTKAGEILGKLGLGSYGTSTASYISSRGYSTSDLVLRAEASLVDAKVYLLPAGSSIALSKKVYTLKGLPDLLKKRQLKRKTIDSLFFTLESHTTEMCMSSGFGGGLSGVDVTIRNIEGKIFFSTTRGTNFSRLISLGGTYPIEDIIITTKSHCKDSKVKVELE